MKNRKNYIFLYKNIYRNRTLLCVRKEIMNLKRIYILKPKYQQQQQKNNN